MYSRVTSSSKILEDSEVLKKQGICNSKGYLVAVAVSEVQADKLIDALNLTGQLAHVVVTVSQGRNDRDLLDQTALELVEGSIVKGSPILIRDCHRRALQDVIDDPKNMFINDNALYLDELLKLLPVSVRG